MTIPCGRSCAPACRVTTLLLGVTMLLCTAVQAQTDDQVIVGSKKFTENVILGEIARGLIASTGVPATHRREIGGTRILWEALLRGDIDVYADYTGTLMQEVLVDLQLQNSRELETALSERGVEMTEPLGFNNTYVLGMRRDRAEELEIEEVSDLTEHPDLRLGFSNEFMDRADGWPGLQRAYQLPHRNVRGLDHDVAYRGIADGALDVIDLYATDAEIRYYDLVPLEDDRGHFPEYHAVFLYKSEFEEQFPEAAEALHSIEGQIPEPRMVQMNASVKLDGEPEARVAADFLEDRLDVSVEVQIAGLWDRLWRATREHITLVGISLLVAVLLAVPLGVVAYRSATLGPVILGIVGVIYTIPALALLVFMIPLFGIGAGPAMIALFLYSLLPIVRNTHAGLTEIPTPIRESAYALGLSSGYLLRKVELPMASGTILAGVKTAAVINIGMATLGALIGAGGYGQPILTGIRLDDTALILEGAVPAALLALLAQAGFGLAEKWVVPRGLRL